MQGEVDAEETVSGFCARPQGGCGISGPPFNFEEISTRRHHTPVKMRNTCVSSQYTPTPTMMSGIPKRIQ